MALDSYRVRETKKVTEKPKTAEELRREIMKDTEALRRMVSNIDELARKSNSDIDQQWIRENESKEFSISTPNQRKQEVSDQMARIGAVGQRIVPDSEKQREVDEWKELENIISGSKQETSEMINQPVAMTNSQQLETTSAKTIEPIDVSPVQPPIVEPISSVKEEPQIQKENVVDNNAEIEELNNIIDSKYNLLVSKLANLYNSEVINSEADSIRSDLQSLMDIKNKSIEELKKVNDALNSLISRYAKLEQKADEVKTTDDFRINQQQKQMNFLRDYQTQLERNYGKYWFGKMSEQEKEQYITLYTAAHKVPREVVEKQIEDSIAIAYNEIVSSTKQSTVQQPTPTLQDSQPQQKQPFHGDYENIIKFNIRTGVENLKQIYSTLQSATLEEIAEFNYLYQALSTASKIKPANEVEEQQKLTQTYEITEKIEQLQNSLSNSNGRSR